MSGRGAYYKAKYGGGGGRGRGRGGSIGGPNEGHRRTKLENAGEHPCLKEHQHFPYADN